MSDELGNKELIEKLPKEGVHCYPANPSKIMTNRIVSVIFCIVGVFLVFIGLLKVSDNIVKIYSFWSADLQRSSASLFLLSLS